MENSQYWTERFKLLEESTYDHSKDFIKNVEKDFLKARDTIKNRISRFYHQFETLTGLNYTDARKALSKGEMKEFKITVEEYIKMGESLDIDFDLEVLNQMKKASLRVRISRLEAIEQYINAEVGRLYGSLQRTVFDILGETFENRYYQTAFELGRFGSIKTSFARLNLKQITEAIKRPWTTTSFSETIWKNQNALMKNLNDTITQSVILGRSYTETIRLFEDRMQVGANNSARIITTEMAAVASNAQHQMFKELDVKQYSIVATLDERTSQICQSLDGQVFKESEYKTGVTAPPFHPNCRSTTAPVVKGVDVSKRIARGKDGKSKFVKNQKYLEWAKENGIEPVYGLWEPEDE